jgi:hypothetical protein
MNRRDIFKGALMTALGAVAAKLGIKPAMEMTFMDWTQDPPDGVDVFIDEATDLDFYPLFDLVDTGEVNERGHKILVPRLRREPQAYFVEE